VKRHIAEYGGNADRVFIIEYSAGAYLAYCRIIGIVTLHLFSGSFRLDFLEEPTQRHAARF